MGVSLGAAAISTSITHPLDFLKTKIQIYNEGIGIRGRGGSAGYNMYKIFTNFYERGYGSRVLYTGFKEHLMSRLSFLTVRNLVYKTVFDYKKPKKWTNDLLVYEKSLLSGVSSVFGVLASNSFECQFIRKVGDVGRK